MNAGTILNVISKNPYIKLSARVFMDGRNEIILICYLKSTSLFGYSLFCAKNCIESEEQHKKCYSKERKEGKRGCKNVTPLLWRELGGSFHEKDRL